MNRVCLVCSQPYQSANIRQRVCPQCLSEAKLCECGCGISIVKWKIYNGRERRFIHGHNDARSGRPLTEGAKLKIRISKDGWIPERAELLKEHYPHKTGRELQAIFPDKSMAAVTTQANKIGLHKTPETLARIAYQFGESQVGSNNHQWRGGRWTYGGHHYGRNWPAQRRKAKARDGYTCQRCTKKFPINSPKLHVHHIVPFRTFDFIPGKNENYLQANKIDNLICLCEKCHAISESVGWHINRLFIQSALFD